MTTKTTEETSQSAISARKSRWARKGRSPRMESDAGDARSRRGPRRGCLRAAELEVELADLELLVGVGRPLRVLLHAVVLVRLDDRQPGKVLEEDLRHLLVGLAAELLVDREARRGAPLVELGVSPVVRY